MVPIHVVSRRYHTIDFTTIHREGETYTVTDDALWETLYGCGLAWPTLYTPLLPPSTGAAAGIPGTWTPQGSRPPSSFTQMDTITATPATAWTAGQYVALADGSKAHWGGSAWVSGNA